MLSAHKDLPILTPEQVEATKRQQVPFKPPFRSKPEPKPPRIFTFSVPDPFCTAFKSAVDDLSDRIGAKLDGPKPYDTERALTHAAIGVAALRAAVNAQVKAGAKDYV
jgi:hypothetical protein